MKNKIIALTLGTLIILGSDGRHRVCAAQELKIAINVIIEGEYKKIE